MKLMASVCCVITLTACSSGGSAAAPSAAPASSAPAAQAAPSCAPAPDAELAWPAQVPSDLPKPPGARLTDVQERTDGLTVVMFTTPTSIRDSVLFLIEALPAAGYTLARGDAENAEADAPFIKGDLRGVMRMIAVEQCRTDWLMAITEASTGAPGGGTPLLPPRPGASPLPFG